MAINRVSFSGEELQVREIEIHFLSLERSLRAFYQKDNLYFMGYTINELNMELEQRLEELDKSTAFTLLASIEAHLRIDFLQRCYNKKKDELSRKFRKLYGQKSHKISLSNDILKLWMQYVDNKYIVSELRGALNYRDWLAHGRYWVGKVGRKYDFYSVHHLAICAQDQLGIEMGA
jgi:hypothetical protein